MGFLKVAVVLCRYVTDSAMGRGDHQWCHAAHRSVWRTLHSRHAILDQGSTILNRLHSSNETETKQFRDCFETVLSQFHFSRADSLTGSLLLKIPARNDKVEFLF